MIEETQIDNVFTSSHVRSHFTLNMNKCDERFYIPLFVYLSEN